MVNKIVILSVLYKARDLELPINDIIAILEHDMEFEGVTLLLEYIDKKAHELSDEKVK